jgi:hypothetical protein
VNGLANHLAVDVRKNVMGGSYAPRCRRSLLENAAQRTDGRSGEAAPQR